MKDSFWKICRDEQFLEKKTQIVGYSQKEVSGHCQRLNFASARNSADTNERKEKEKKSEEEQK